MSLTTSGTKILRDGKEFRLRSMHVTNRCTTIKADDNKPAANYDESWFAMKNGAANLKSLNYNTVDLGLLLVSRACNNDGSINLSFFENFIDRMVEDCNQNGLYSIIAYQRFNATEGMFNNYGWYHTPSWFWTYGEGRAKATTWSGVARTVIDFYNYSVPKMNQARENYIKLLEFTANRYKNNSWVLISPRNEPQHFIHKETTNIAEKQAILEGYYQLHTEAIDRMRATGFNGITSIEVPYAFAAVDGREKHVMNIDRPNLIYEYHSYMKPDGSKPYNDWVGPITTAMNATHGFNKPFYLGEFGIYPPSNDPPNLMPEPLFISQTEEMFGFIDSKELSDSVHSWSMFYGLAQKEGDGWTPHQVDIYMGLEQARPPITNGENEMSFQYKNEDTTDLTVYKRKIVVQDTPVVIPAGGSVTITLDQDEILVQK